jgi:hypothetical protein
VASGYEKSSDDGSSNPDWLMIATVALAALVAYVALRYFMG